MKKMKEAAPVEIDALRRRTLRSLAMNRIDKEDNDYIVKRLDEIEARVKTMKERSGDDSPR